MIRSLRTLIAVLGFSFLNLHTAPAQTEMLTVFAAASLKETFEQVGQSFSEKTGTQIRFSFASSSVLAKQIEAGAPADLFASADLAWMDYLDQRHLVKSETRVDRLGNDLVVVAPRSSPLTDLALTEEAFTKALGEGRLATGEVNSVPVGVYAKAAFQHLKLWPLIEPRLAQAENVRAALAFVSRGEVGLGVVYKTDAQIDPSVKIVATFPSESHAPIIYPFALTATSRSASAQDFLAFLQGSEARMIFEKAGFRVLK